MILRPVAPHRPAAANDELAVGFTRTFLSLTSNPASRTTGRTIVGGMPARSCALSIMSGVLRRYHDRVDCDGLGPRKSR